MDSDLKLSMSLSFDMAAQSLGLLTKPPGLKHDSTILNEQPICVSHTGNEIY